MKKTVVGEIVHYVAGQRDICQAALVVGAYPRSTHLRIFGDTNWKKASRLKVAISYSKKPLHRTWHHLEDCKLDKKKKS
jgi:CRISPR type III-B/RAMP module RAMP protein Cmr1